MSLAQSTLWSQDSPASLSRALVSAEVNLMLAGSGQKYVGSFDPRGPLGFALRTFLGLSAWDSMTYSAIWSLRATKRRRVYIRLRRLGRRTNASVSSSSATASATLLAPLWLTPNASDENGGKVARPGATNTRIGPSGKKQQLLLKQQVREQRETQRTQWPTPVAGNGTGTRAYRDDGTPYPNHEPSLTLLDAIRLYPPSPPHRTQWPTPTSTAGDGRSEQTPEMWSARRERTLAEKGIHNGLPLNVAVQMARSWSTPAAQDAKNAALPVSPATRDTLPGDLLRDGAAGKLNPAWVTQLMGFPDGWLDIPTQQSSSPTAGPPAPVKRNTHLSRRACSRPATAPQDAPQS